MKMEHNNYLKDKENYFTLYWFSLSEVLNLVLMYFKHKLYWVLSWWKQASWISNYAVALSSVLRRKWAPIVALFPVACAYKPFQLFLHMLPSQVCFVWQVAIQNAETLRFAVKGGLIHKAAKQRDGRINLRFTSPKVRGLRYLWDKE